MISLMMHVEIDWGRTQNESVHDWIMVFAAASERCAEAAMISPRFPMTS